MQNEIIVNASDGETRVAILERGNFADFFVERARDRSMVSSIAKGRVTRVLPGMQAAFVDISLEKAAFLYAGDYIPENGSRANGSDEGTGRPQRGRRNGGQPPKIESMLREGEEVIVQVAKEPIGTKGARITSHLSIPGRHLVLTPSGKRVGVSRRIESDRERRRLREIVERLRPRDLGFIIRTAGDGLREADLAADIKYLTEIWEQTQIRKEQVRAPAVLYQEPPLALRVIRDLANADTKRIVIDSKTVYDEMKQFVARFVADPAPRIEHYTGAAPIYDHFGVERQIDANLGRKVWLKSGGYLIIDQSEALTAIDVNTGRYVGKRDLEETVLKTNLEAVKEVANQLRLRNIGGLIIIDLIDMEPSENRDKVNRNLQETFRYDKSRTNILRISELGLVEMTRKRTRESLVQTLCEPCPYCEGKSYVLSVETVAFRVLREIRKDRPRFCGRRIAVSVSRPVAELLLGAEAEALAALERDLGCEIEIRAQPGLHQEQFEVSTLDSGPPVSFVPSWLEYPRKADEPAAEVESDADESETEAPEAPDSTPPPALEAPGRFDEGPAAADAEATPLGIEPGSVPAALGASSGLEATAPASPGEPADGPDEEPPGELANDAQALDDEAEFRILPAPEKAEDL